MDLDDVAGVHGCPFQAALRVKLRSGSCRRTAWWRGRRLPSTRRCPQPEPGPGQVLVRVGAAGLCHSDLHVIHEFDAGVFNAELPFTLGHETAGWVEALGPGATGLEVGEAVAVYGPLGCGTCARCQTGDENICDRGRRAARGRMGPRRRRRDGAVHGRRQRAPARAARRPRPGAGRAAHRRRGHAVPSDPAVARPASVRARSPSSSGSAGSVTWRCRSCVRSPRRRSSRSTASRRRSSSRRRSAPTTPSRPAPTRPPTITDLTKGRGVDATFDLVGNEATLALALAIARAADRGSCSSAPPAGRVPYSLWATKFEVELSTSMLGQHQRPARRDRPRPRRPASSRR